MSYCSKTGLYTGYIYCIENTVNHKRYIGQTSKTITERFNEHVWDAKHRSKNSVVLHNAIIKYGCDSFTVEEVAHISAVEKKELRRLLNNLEIHYIHEYGTLVPNGYNVCRGGNIRQEDIEKIVFCFTKDGKFVASYPSIAEAGRCTGIDHGKISTVANRKDKSRQSAGGYIWSFDENPPSYTADRGKERRRAVKMMTMSGEMIKTFDSAASASLALSLQATLITACCAGRRKSTGGYRWAYFDYKK